MLKALYLIAAALAFGGASAQAAPQTKAAAARDWTKSVVATPEGGFRMGNPNAPLKLLEFGSLTCGHCAHFAEEGMPQLLSKYVKSGRVSFEYRNFVRNPYDLAGSLLGQCAGPGSFFPLTHQIFATQQEWMTKVKPHVQAIGALPESQRVPRIATVTGLDAMAANAGVPAARAKQCLNDTRGIGKLLEIRKQAVDTYKLEGTPTFILNGKNTGVADWVSLQPLLGPPGS